MNPYEYTIRSVEPEDFEAWASMLKDLFAECEFLETDMFSELNIIFSRFWIDHPTVHCWVAETIPKDGGSGLKVGFLQAINHDMLMHYRPALYVSEMYVVPKYRRIGVGTALLKHASKIASENGYSSIYWGTQISNFAARAMYDKITECQYLLYGQGFERKKHD